MNSKKGILSLLYVVVVMLVILSVGIVSTYAWFTSNQKVYTTTVNATTGSDEIRLLLGSSAQNLSEEPCVITEDNMNGEVVLYPVSTSDLNTFVAMEGTQRNTTYRRITDQDQYYYHGVFYLQAQGSEDREVTLYLDQRENDLIEAADRGNVLNASRFALVINGQGDILTVSEENNADIDRTENTYLNGQLVTGEKVITLDEQGNPQAVSLNPLYLANAGVRMNGEVTVYPDYAYTIRTNTTYPCDVYFYLEGTDADCSDAISFEQLDLSIALLGVVG